jgi:DNA-binding IclR family transcriptional regulator
VRLGLSAIADLRDAINETTALAVWGGQGPVIVRWERPRRPITVNVITGATLSLLASAAGRVFAAWLPPAQIEPLVQAELDSGKCRANVQTLDEARTVLAEVRARGLAAISGHYMVRGVEAMAAPVFNFKQDITLGLVVVGVEGSLDMREDSPTVTALREAAHALSLRLGYAPPAA